jgi:hypothetical protein
MSRLRWDRVIPIGFCLGFYGALTLLAARLAG